LIFMNAPDGWKKRRTRDVFGLAAISLCGSEMSLRVRAQILTVSGASIHLSPTGMTSGGHVRYALAVRAIADYSRRPIPLSGDTPVLRIHAPSTYGRMVVSR